jgi:hypothetical protein
VLAKSELQAQPGQKEALELLESERLEPRALRVVKAAQAQQVLLVTMVQQELRVSKETLERLAQQVFLVQLELLVAQGLQVLDQQARLALPETNTQHLLPLH